MADSTRKALPTSTTTMPELLGPGDETDRHGSSSPVSSSGQPPTTLEVLGDHLYAKIEELSETEPVDFDVAKLTGILLECGEGEVCLFVCLFFLLCASLQQHQNVQYLTVHSYQKEEGVCSKLMGGLNLIIYFVFSFCNCLNE